MKLIDHEQGVIPDFDNPKLVGYHSLTIGCSVCIVLAVSFAAARLYAKVMVIGKTSIDDCKYCALSAS
jgi:hypothetical protein